MKIKRDYWKVLMQNKTFLTDLVCTGCGNVAQIRRKSKRLKGVGHIKDLWCYKCEMVTKHFEVRDISKFIYDEDMSFELEGLKEDERRGKVLKKVLEKRESNTGARRIK